MAGEIGRKHTIASAELRHERAPLRSGGSAAVKENDRHDAMLRQSTAPAP